MEQTSIIAQSPDSENIKLIKNDIQNRHKKISSQITPKNEVFQKMDLDYVKLGYMKRQADEYYPGWSWEIINSSPLGDAAYVVHGRLTYIDGVVKRVGDMVAAHRIQKSKRDGNYVDVGNDIKAANTDCMKKAFNVYMNIADDIYKNADTTLKDSEKGELLNLAKKLGSYDQILKYIKSGEIDRDNYDNAFTKLTRKLEKLSEKETSNETA